LNFGINICAVIFYRGILSEAETAAGSFLVADAYTRIGQGYYAEYKSFKAGGCH